jgi:hypothetical protein
LKTPPSEATKRYPVREMGAAMAKAVNDPVVPELPTATQVAFVTQDTPFTFVWTVPWFGVLDTMDHAVPFQVTARLAGVGPEVAAAEPTALHVVALKQSTPFRTLLAVAEVSGTDEVSAHCVPFQFSIRFCVRVGPVLTLTWPTAWQKETPAHDTALSWLPIPVEGCVIVWSVQAVPFHSSPKDVPVGCWVSLTPTAMHQLAVTQSMPDALGTGVVSVEVGVAAVVAVRVVPFHWFPKSELVVPTVEVPRTSQVVAVTHETEERVVVVLPVGAAAVTNVHCVPFQVSATAVPVPEPPTAMQKLVPTHDTELRKSPVVAGAFTLGTTVHLVPFHS